jgi:hypothetical protein
MMRFPGDGTSPSAGAVFTVAHPNGSASIWVMNYYNVAERRVEYVRVIPGSNAARIEIRVSSAAGGHSTAEVSYALTSLSAAGDSAVDLFVETFPQRKPHWEQAINHYLRTGKPLVH